MRPCIGTKRTPSMRIPPRTYDVVATLVASFPSIVVDIQILLGLWCWSAEASLARARVASDHQNTHVNSKNGFTIWIRPQESYLQAAAFNRVYDTSETEGEEGLSFGCMSTGLFQAASPLNALSDTLALQGQAFSCATLHRNSFLPLLGVLLSTKSSIITA